MGMIHSVILACVEGHWFVIHIHTYICMLQGRENRIQEWQEGIKAKRLTNYEEAINRLPKWTKHLTHTEMGLLTESCSSCRSAHFEVMCYRTRSIFNDFFSHSPRVIFLFIFLQKLKGIARRRHPPPSTFSYLKEAGNNPSICWSSLGTCVTSLNYNHARFPC